MSLPKFLTESNIYVYCKKSDLPFLQKDINFTEYAQYQKKVFNVIGIYKIDDYTAKKVMLI